MGCATLRDDGPIDLRKDVGKVDEVAARLGLTEMVGRRGIIQLRWATFGAPSQVNAQPHLDSDGDLVSGINETTCRGGRAVVIGEEDPSLRVNAHDLIVLPQTGPLFNPLLAVLPLQLLSYRLSLARGYDPDFPRNLSKTLTVD